MLIRGSLVNPDFFRTALSTDSDEIGRNARVFLSATELPRHLIPSEEDLFPHGSRRSWFGQGHGETDLVIEKDIECEFQNASYTADGNVKDCPIKVPQAPMAATQENLRSTLKQLCYVPV